jgi:hypothetical protein
VRYEFRPLGTWAGPSTPDRERKRPAFRAGYRNTLDLLLSETVLLGARHLILQVDLTERDIRTDGMPRASARYGSHPGVVLSFESRFGPLRYATDAFTEWQANLRAIALSLRALRAVDRYGVSRRGEQYTGWRALPRGDGSSFGGADEALGWMRRCYAARQGRELHEAESLAAGDLHRHLKRMLHPDAGGDRADWDRLGNARQLLVTAGLL